MYSGNQSGLKCKHAWLQKIYIFYPQYNSTIHKYIHNQLCINATKCDCI